MLVILGINVAYTEHHAIDNIINGQHGNKNFKIARKNKLLILCVKSVCAASDDAAELIPPGSSRGARGCPVIVGMPRAKPTA